ncbi:MAG: Glycoside hydrolase, 38 vacuolar alpha mannosidase [Alyxoria varia]|nr:MAG: Glycoside hydrolase, 38 vacuolar alpha mannosidase [Alyxoria varia]
MGGDNKAPMASSYPKLAGPPVGKQIHRIYRDRLPMFTSTGQYESQSLLAKLYEGRASGEPSVKLSVWSAPDLSRPTFKDATSESNEYHSTRVGASFGPSWSTHWFRIHMTVPEDLKDKRHLEFHWDANNEGMVWSEDGEPLQGLTGGGERVAWVLPKSFRDGKEHTFYIEMSCNAMFGNGKNGETIAPPSPDKYFILNTADIVAVNLEARALYFDFWEIGDAAREFPEDSWEEHAALQVCNSIMDTFIAGEGSQDSVSEGRKIAQKYIGSKVNSSEVYDEPEHAIVSAIGHCHIDTCWLWPWAETKRKVARSWLNQCDLMDRYPEHRFCASQAQQYKWLETYYPSAFDRVKAKVKQGTFQPIGGSWVEHDTNMPTGESLVRQFLYGQRFFEAHFAERSTTFWLPDTFGYSSQIPQICRLAGMGRFFTQKLSWNNINDFPHTTFNWVGLDGSQVMCHMAPDNTYTAEADFGDVKRSVTQHKSMDQDPTSLLVFGKGDGGGGPTWEQLEKLRRCRGMSDTTSGLLPRVKMGDSVDDFFARLEKKAETTDFVSWVGELYFELHRGTYTTQANNKRNNRRAEIMLHDIEYLATLASIQDDVRGTSTGYKYPKRDLDSMWEDVLLCQFHDCLPGSSIEMCYDDSDELYRGVFRKGETLLRTAITALGFTDPDKGQGELVAINTLPFERQELVTLGSHDQSHARLIKPASKAHARSVGLYHVHPEPPSYRVENPAHVARATQISDDVFVLENPQLKVTITAGVVTSMYDRKARREVLAPGAKANQFVIYDDKPLYWQAWDVEVYHLASRKELPAGQTTLLENGPHRASVVTETKISENSWVKSTASLACGDLDDDDDDDGSAGAATTTTGAGLPGLLEFTCECEWREDKKFLKVEFPVDVHSTSATYETQFGTVSRPTHYNTSWDMAKFEVCCHRWADLSEHGYGVSVVNDGKYGFACQGSTMRLSLLRAPKAPDAHADMGRHFFRYGVMGHAGPAGAETVKKARAFNNPVVAPQGSRIGVDGVEALFPYTGFDSYVFRHPGSEGGGRLDGSGSSSSSSSSSSDGVITPTDQNISIFMSSFTLSPNPHHSNPSIVLDTIKRGEDDPDVRIDASIPSAEELQAKESPTNEKEKPAVDPEENAASHTLNNQQPPKTTTTWNKIHTRERQHTAFPAAALTQNSIPVRKGKSVILRVCETLGGKSKGTLVIKGPVGGKVKGVGLCNLLEDDVGGFNTPSMPGSVSVSDQRSNAGHEGNEDVTVGEGVDEDENVGEEGLKVVKGEDGDVRVVFVCRAFEVKSFRVLLDV